MQIIYQNEALDISFSEKLVPRSLEVTRSKKSPKYTHTESMRIFWYARVLIDFSLILSPKLSIEHWIQMENDLWAIGYGP